MVEFLENSRVAPANGEVRSPNGACEDFIPTAAPISKTGTVGDMDSDYLWLTNLHELPSTCAAAPEGRTTKPANSYFIGVLKRLQGIVAAPGTLAKGHVAEPRIVCISL